MAEVCKRVKKETSCRSKGQIEGAYLPSTCSITSSTCSCPLLWAGPPGASLSIAMPFAVFLRFTPIPEVPQCRGESADSDDDSVQTPLPPGGAPDDLQLERGESQVPLGSAAVGVEAADLADAPGSGRPSVVCACASRGHMRAVNHGRSDKPLRDGGKRSCALTSALRGREQ